jgi:hypothetical protein
MKSESGPGNEHLVFYHSSIYPAKWNQNGGWAVILNFISFASIIFVCLGVFVRRKGRQFLDTLLVH